MKRPPPLRDPAFARFWTAQSVSYLGDQVTLIALPLVAVLVLGASTAQVGYLATAATLPTLLLGLHAGAWADRVARPRVALVAADLGRAVLMASVPLAWALDALTLAQLYAVAGLAGTANVCFNVNAVSVVPALVAPADRVAANALIGSSYSFSWVAGPSIGGGLVQLLSAPLALALDAVSFAGSGLLLRRLRLPDRIPVARDGDGIATGLRLLARDPILRPLLAHATLLNLCYTTYFTLLLLFAVRVVGLTPGQIGLALGAGAVGGLTGSIACGRITRRLGVGPTLLVGAFVYPAALLAVPLAAHVDPWPACAVIAAAEFASGFGLGLDDINSNSLLQTVAAPGVLGRVSGARLTLVYGSRSLAALLAAALGTWLGLGTTMALAAAVGTLGVVLLVRSPVRGLRELAAV